MHPYITPVLESDDSDDAYLILLLVSYPFRYLLKRLNKGLSVVTNLLGCEVWE